MEKTIGKKVDVASALRRKLRKALKKALKGQYAKDIKVILSAPGWKELFTKAQVFAYFYEVNSRGIHTLRVALVALDIADYFEKEFGVKIDRDRLLAKSLGHDKYHYPTGHEAEIIIEAIFGYCWDHAKQGVWMNGAVLKTGLDPYIIDAIGCHSKISKEMVFDPNKEIYSLGSDGQKIPKLEVWLLEENYVPASLEAIILKIADKLVNAYNDIYDGSVYGFKIPVELKELLKSLGEEEDKVYKYFIKSLKLEGNKVVFGAYEEFSAMKRFAYDVIHAERNVKETYKEYKVIMAKTILGIEHILSKGEIIPKKGIALTSIVHDYNRDYGHVYEGIYNDYNLRMLTKGTKKELIMARDIFTLRNDYGLIEVGSNLAYLAKVDKDLREKIMCAEDYVRNII